MSVSTVHCKRDYGYSINQKNTKNLRRLLRSARCRSNVFIKITRIILPAPVPSKAELTINIRIMDLARPEQPAIQKMQNVSLTIPIPTLLVITPVKASYLPTPILSLIHRANIF